MGNCLQIDLLRDSWLAYLLGQGHRVVDAPESIVVVRSRNGSRKPFRWLLATCEGPARAFTREERSRLRREISQASRAKEKPYVVVGFSGDLRRIIVVPAAAVLKARCIRADKGGIAWEE